MVSFIEIQGEDSSKTDRACMPDPKSWAGCTLLHAFQSVVKCRDCLVHLLQHPYNMCFAGLLGTEDFAKEQNRANMHANYSFLSEMSKSTD
jgi:hypothetical protein